MLVAGTRVHSADIDVPRVNQVLITVSICNREGCEKVSVQRCGEGGDSTKMEEGTKEMLGVQMAKGFQEDRLLPATESVGGHSSSLRSKSKKGGVRGMRTIGVLATTRKEI